MSDAFRLQQLLDLRRRAEEEKAISLATAEAEHQHLQFALQMLLSQEAAQLASCYARSLALAEEHGVRTLAFPAISTGVYGYPLAAACKVAFSAVLAHRGANVAEVRFVLFSDEAYQIYEATARKLGVA